MASMRGRGKEELRGPCMEGPRSWNEGSSPYRMTHPPSSRREEQRTEDVQLSKVNIRLNTDGREPSVRLSRLAIIIETMEDIKTLNC